MSCFLEGRYFFQYYVEDRYFFPQCVEGDFLSHIGACCMNLQIVIPFNKKKLVLKTKIKHDYTIYDGINIILSGNSQTDNS